MNNKLLVVLFVILPYCSFSQSNINKSSTERDSTNSIENITKFTQSRIIKSVSDVTVSLPIYEDFESVTPPLIPDDWYKIVNTNDPYANVRSFTWQGVDDSQCVKLVNVTDLNPDLLLISPQIDGGAAGLYLHFYSWAYFNSQLSIGTMSDPSDVSTYTELEVLDIPNENDMEEYEVDFSTYTGTDEYIAFKGVFFHTSADIALDNITINDPAQSCPSPSDMNTSEMTQTSALLEWTENGEATLWNIEHGDLGFTPTGTVTAIADANPFLLEGLDEGTYYDYYVQADCGSETSDWVGPCTFATGCYSASLPCEESFEDVSVPHIPPCNTIENTNGDTWTWATSNSSPKTGLNHLMIAVDPYNQMDDWFFSPALELIGGQNHIVTFNYTSNSDVYLQSLEVKFGTEPNSASMSTDPIFSDVNFAYNNVYQEATTSFSPDEDGVYFLGWHGFSDPNWNSIYIDDILIELDPNTGINNETNEKKLDVTIAPNPSNGLFSVDITTADIVNISIRVFNTMGHELFKTNKISLIGRGQVDIDLRMQPKGMYYLYINSGNINCIEKVIIE